MKTFSARVKEELLDRFKEQGEDRYILLGLALLSNGRLREDHLRFSTAQKDLADMMAACLDEEIGLPVEIRQGKELVTLSVEGKKELDLLNRFWREDFGYDRRSGRLADEWVRKATKEDEDGAVVREEDLHGCGDVAGEQRSAPHYIRTLQSIFLAGGSLAEPSRFYQLELAIRRRPLAEQVMDLMLALNLPVSLIERSDYFVLYMKDANGIGDFLALTGAHVARLDFGNFRLKRELRNHVNRLVNCDSANSRRIADASARQMQSLEALKTSPRWESLPENLQQTAELRLAYPDLSLRELGELLDPPLAKSGVSHRLRRLTEISESSRTTRFKEEEE